jgi:hypothetical protein
MNATPPSPPDRRQRRSDDPVTALHYQLSSTRRDVGAEAVVLVDDSGCMLAGAGAWPVCEELAAYAPLFADSSVAFRPAVSTRLASLSAEVETLSFEVEGQLVVLSARGSRSPRQEALARAVDGVRRILAA